MTFPTLAIDLTYIEVFLIVVSPAIGSFLALVSDRLPRNEDVIFKPSACRNCEVPLQTRDLIPLVSYLFLRGQCRNCSAPIPAMLPLMEVSAFMLAIACAYAAQSDLQFLLGCGFLWCLLALFACDAQWFRLPDPLNAALLLFAFALAWEDPYMQLTNALLGAIVGSTTFLAIRIAYHKLRGREGLGLGDVKLMAGIGAAVGVLLLPVVVLIASLTALLWAIGQYFYQGKPLQGQTAQPFGSFLCISTALVWLLA